MNTIKVLTALLTILLLQTMLLNRYEWLQPIDLFLVMNAYFALHLSQMSCIALSLTSGLVQDAFSEGIMGMNAFSKTILIFLISALSSRIVVKQPVLSLLVGVASSVDFLILYGLHRLFNLGVAFSFKTLLASMVLNAVMSLPAFWVGDKIRVRKEYA